MGITFGFTVTKVEKQIINGYSNGRHKHKKSTSVFHASKLMIASGLTSTPNVPVLPNRDNFNGQIQHQRGFEQSSALSSSDKHITVPRGAKSAVDMVHASVKTGKSVIWIVRRLTERASSFLQLRRQRSLQELS